MISVRELHDEAMQYAQIALVAREQGQSDKASKHAFTAYQKEREALNTFLANAKDEARIEPTRSILIHSAASLAYQAGLLDDALRLVEQGLQGTPSWRVQADLLGLRGEIAFHQRQIQTAPPTPDTLELALAGSAILDGGAISFDELHGRLNSMVLSVRQMLQQRLQLSAQDARAVLNPIVYPVQAGSAIITVQFQLVPNLTGGTRELADANVPTAISDVIRAIGYVNASNLAAFAEMIPNRQAQSEFLAHLRVLAPDGVQVTSMGLRDSKQALLFERTADEIQVLIDDLQRDDRPPQEITIVGRIISANVRKHKPMAVIVVKSDEDNQEYTFKSNDYRYPVSRWIFSYVHEERVRIVGRWDGDAYEIVDFYDADRDRYRS